MSNLPLGRGVRKRNNEGSVDMSNQSQRVQLQDIREFTVQIRDPRGTPYGTGFIVSSDGKIVTCAHVVQQALGVPLTAAGDIRLTIYMHEGRVRGLRHAVVSAYYTDYQDDVVLLQLVDGPFPLPPSQVAVLGRATDSLRNPFQSYGFRPLPPEYIAGYAEGMILGPVDSPLTKKLQMDPIQIRSAEIDAGMSGSPVLDTKRNLVIGVVTSTYRPATSMAKDRDTAWAVDASVLALLPFNLRVRDTPLPFSLGMLLYMNTPAIHAVVKQKPGHQLYNAPLPLPEWTGREDMLEAMSEDWSNSECKVTSIVGIGGEGKSSVARRWLDILLQDSTQVQPEGVFWWSFYDAPAMDSFFEAALAFVWSGQVPEGIALDDIVEAPEQFIAGMLSAKRYLFILDGLERVQQESGEQYGLLQDSSLSKFLSYFATLSHDSHCLITSRAPVIDLIRYTTYTQRYLGPLSIDEGAALLHRLGVSGSTDELEAQVEKRGGYALTLSQTAILLVKQYGGSIAYINQIPLWSNDEDSQKRVYKILMYYDTILTSYERTFLLLCSAFRAAVPENALPKFFRKSTNYLNTTLSQLSDQNFDRLVIHVLEYMILRKNQQQAYTFHPLFQKYYVEQLLTLPKREIEHVYRDIAAYYEDMVAFYEKQAKECFTAVELESTPGHWDRLRGGLARSTQTIARYMQRGHKGDWRIAIASYAVGFAASAAAGLLLDPQTWKSAARYTTKVQEGWKYKREAKRFQQEALYYKGLVSL
jgi:Trypsin-like peptidase domain